ncbi:MAG TPA: DUF2284 domain-containing protein [Thermodesulfovibrionales bacterium]|nr:DUF2284 domain-containing protein [Thermodesulfovibrionales bacterium]
MKKVGCNLPGKKSKDFLLPSDNALPHLTQNPQERGPQYLENLATGYWFSEVLFTAVETKIFTHLDAGGKSLHELSRALAFDPRGLERFLGVLCALGLVTHDSSQYCNSNMASEYLVIGKEQYQGDSILWRKELCSYWSGMRHCLRLGRRVRHGSSEDKERTEGIRKYINAMDCVARTKVKDILALFEGLSFDGKMLDVGAGSGAIAAGFLGQMPSLKATLIDIPEVLYHTREFMQRRGLGERSSFVAQDILEPWPDDTARYDLIVLSNVIHAYSEQELPHILASASRRLKLEGFLVIHDFFLEHCPEKAALFDLNMLINTYNGRVFSNLAVRQELAALKLSTTGLIPLSTDTALIIAANTFERLMELRLSTKTRLVARLRDLGFVGATPISVESIHVADWADVRCRYGCGHYGKAHCPPHSPSPEKTRKVLADYSHAILLEGEPPTGEFQLKVLGAEREAFKAGFYKAFAYWAGPCSLCSTCTTDGVCRRTKEARPSMEGAGIDVFKTVWNAGGGLRTLERRGDFVKYYGLLLLE